MSTTDPIRLPADCALLPLQRGSLLVSRDHALFCRVPAQHVAVVAAVVAGTAPATDLAPALVEELARHGFGGPARRPDAAHPSVQLQLTNGCNLECSYCCTNSGEPRAAEITYEQAREVVQAVRAVHGEGTRVGLLGGEPLLVPWALDLAEDALALGLHVTVFTNGTRLVDEDVARRLASLQRRGVEVRVSLAGPTAERCDTESGASRYEAVLEGVRSLARHGGEALVDLMLLPEHVHDVAEALPELRRQLPAGSKIAFGVAYHSGREQGAHLFDSRAELERALDRIAFEAGEVIPGDEPSPVAPRREGCTCALGHHLHVRSDGALFTCFKMEERVGDLRDHDFAHALARLDERARPVATLPLCADCALATLCGGGCRSENLQLTGDADVPICGPWRVRVLCELLAEDRPSALKWSAAHLLAEARAREIRGPEALVPVIPSRHLLDT
jgi:radical SAM protein with 4Fe4S-binding SPASM domain